MLLIDDIQFFGGKSRTQEEFFYAFEALIAAKKQIIINALKKSGGSYTEAAKLLGLHPNYLHRLARNLNLKEQLK